MIEVGQTVTWQTRPYEPVKTGVVVAILPANVFPRKVFPEYAHTSMSQRKLDSLSTKDRVLIRVDRAHKITGDSLKPWYYAPHVSVIEKALKSNG